MISRDFLAQRVYDMTKEALFLSGKKPADIWKAIAETSDDELYRFYSRLVAERRADV
jgi:hypothetical protein